MPGPMLMQAKPVFSAMSRSASSMCQPNLFRRVVTGAGMGPHWKGRAGAPPGDMPTFALYVISNGSFAANETANAVTGGMKYSW